MSLPPPSVFFFRVYDAAVFWQISVNYFNFYVKSKLCFQIFTKKYVYIWNLSEIYSTVTLLVCINGCRWNCFWICNNHFLFLFCICMYIIFFPPTFGWSSCYPYMHVRQWRMLLEWQRPVDWWIEPATGLSGWTASPSVADAPCVAHSFAWKGEQLHNA